jgi:hypothetical protein
MTFPLVRHADAPCDAVHNIAAEIGRTANGGLEIKYIVSGSIADIALPDPLPPERSHHLWRNTCFEVFVRLPSEPGYREFNFAPSACWAAYQFEARRAGMADIEDAAPPIIQTAQDDASLTMTVSLSTTGLPLKSSWKIGLSVIIEELSGRLSFWALAHPPGAADFHHDDCFALTLPPLETTP